jgi:hypothetical protein
MSETNFELSLNDIATMVCDHYQTLKLQDPNEKTGVLFNKAIDKFYTSWGVKKDYLKKEFKSAIGTIVQSRKKLKKTKPIQVKAVVQQSTLTEDEQEELEIWLTLNQNKRRSFRI